MKIRVPRKDVLNNVEEHLAHKVLFTLILKSPSASGLSLALSSAKDFRRRRLNSNGSTIEWDPKSAAKQAYSIRHDNYDWLIQFTMPPKGASTKVAAMRLPPLPKLRVRRPNQADANPCLGIMSAVLSMYTVLPPMLLWNRQLMISISMLGLFGLWCCGLRNLGVIVKSLYGPTGESWGILCQESEGWYDWVL
jgi:hypothetical protein